MEAIENLSNAVVQPVRYVTYLDDGSLDGCYLQAPPEAHANRMIAIDEAQASAWVNYRANADRDAIEQAPPPSSAQTGIIVPQQVTMRQARLALLGAGKLALIDPAIDALPSPVKEGARIEWDYSSAVDRHRPLVATIGAALGMDDAALDALFITAAGL